MAQRRDFLITRLDKDVGMHLRNEVRLLEEALFGMPVVAGGAPKAFMDALSFSNEHLCLHTDGVEAIAESEAGGDSSCTAIAID